MRCTIQLKPVKVTGRTKAEVQNEIMRRFNCTWVCGSQQGGVKYNAYRKADRSNGHVSMTGDFVMVNYEKFRHKNKDTAKGREPVRDAHWDAYVYVVPARLVKSAKQGTRNFKIVVG